MPEHPTHKTKEPSIKIYARKKDYYDGIQAYGQDNSIVYRRKLLIKKPNNKTYKLVFSNPSAKEILGELKHTQIENYGLILETEIIIFFCGVVYPCFVYKHTNKRDHTTAHHCYSVADISETIKRYGSKEQVLRWNNKKHKFSWIRQNQAEWVPKIFELSKHLKNDRYIYELHHKLGVPIFAYVKSFVTDVVLLNPTLKNYKFYKVVDTYTAFQEISMFISGILGGTSPPMIEVSNDTKIAKHGYDKWSFRREPWKKIK